MRRFVSWAAAVLGLAAVVLVLALGLGVLPIPGARLAGVLFGAGDSTFALVLWQLRLPRFVAGLMAGAALGAAGCLLQAALRNDLADPGLLGVSSGASLVIACVVVMNLPVPPGLLPALAMAGGLLAGLVILAASRAVRDPVQMILIGAALASLFGALILFVIVLGTGLQIQIVYAYLIGTLAGRGWADVLRMAPWLGGSLVVAAALVRPLGLLQLGDEVAEGLGLRVVRTRMLAMVVAIALTAPVVATCGPIGFVALVAPHLARAALRTGAIAQVLPLSAAIGALLLATADLAARWVVMPAELPVGLVATAIGAPAAVLLLRRHARMAASA